MSNTDYDVSKRMLDLAAIVDMFLKQEIGEEYDLAFSVVVYNSGPTGMASYVSNCSREDATAGLRELLAYWDAGNPDIPVHKRQ